MEKPISSGLRTTFLVHAIIGIALGLVYLLIPETAGNLLNWDMGDPAYRLLGAALVALGVSSWLAYKAGTWGEVKILVQLEVVWTVLAALVLLWGLISAAIPLIGWANLVLLVLFAIAFGYFYTRH